MKMPLQFNNLAQEPTLDHEINLDELRIASSRRKKHSMKLAPKPITRSKQHTTFQSPGAVRPNMLNSKTNNRNIDSFVQSKNPEQPESQEKVTKTAYNDQNFAFYDTKDKQRQNIN